MATVGAPPACLRSSLSLSPPAPRTLGQPSYRLHIPFYPSSSSLKAPPSPSPSRFVLATTSSTNTYSSPEEEPNNASSNLNSVTPSLADISPLLAVKWTALAAFALTILRQVYRVFCAPAFWMYSSWLLVVWPLPAALAFGVWTLFAAMKQSKNEAKEWEQVGVLVGALTWLILAPLGLRHGYVDGWPLLLFSVYMLFFLMSAIIRLRKFGKLSPRSEDKQWASTPSRVAQIAFIIAVVVGHWAVMFQGPPLYFCWNWEWPSRIAIAIIALAVVVHYSATYFLGKYFDRLVKPTALVVFGPYRFVRHPIYSSYMLLFAGYCVALRAYWSMALLLLASFLYYEQRVKLEEDMLLEAFGDQYKAYKEKVKYKYFLPLY